MLDFWAYQGLAVRALQGNRHPVRRQAARDSTAQALTGPDSCRKHPISAANDMADEVARTLAYWQGALIAWLSRGNARLSEWFAMGLEEEPRLWIVELYMQYRPDLKRNAG